MAQVSFLIFANFFTICFSCCSIFLIGGHTTEMLRLVRAIDCTRYSPRIYVVADTDEHSERKVLEFEQISLSGANDFCFHRIPRSREVRQSYLTSVFTTLRATLSAVPLILRERPFLLLCNGPGTCIPICAAFLILKVWNARISSFLYYILNLLYIMLLSLFEQVFSFGPRLLVCLYMLTCFMFEYTFTYDLSICGYTGICGECLSRQVIECQRSYIILYSTSRWINRLLAGARSAIPARQISRQYIVNVYSFNETSIHIRNLFKF